MEKITSYIFKLSPKRIAMYLVLVPLLLFLAHTIVTIIFRTISENPSLNGTTLGIVLLVLSVCSGLIILLWLIWLPSVVYSVSKAQLGIPRKWFQIAYLFLWTFMLFNLMASIIEYLAETHSWEGEYMHLIYASREFINFGGIMIAYPIVCHYAARAATSIRSNKPATLVNSIPFTLFLIFGTVVGVPFLHKYFSKQPSTNSEIVVIYAIAFGLFAIILIIGFIAAITGMV